MSVFSAENLQVWTGGHWVGTPPARITGWSNDTRSLAEGDVFIALKTANRDGHDFLADAAARGASCALVSREVPHAPIPQLVVVDVLESFQRAAAIRREKFRGTVFAVTGSVGKTSTKDLLKRILGADSHATHANLNNLIGVPLTLTGIRPEHTSAVIEAGMSEPGELERSAWIIRPDVAVITNVQPAHLQGLGSLDGIAREKSALCRHTSSRGLSVFPADCLRYAEFRRLLGRRVPVVFEGDAVPERKDGVLDVVHARLAQRGDGHLLTLSGGSFGTKTFEIGAVSDGLAKNAALAATAALFAGVDEARIAAGLASWTPSSGRGEVTWHEGRAFYIDCYNASPASMSDAAECFVRRTPGAEARLFVLGGMNELGDDSSEWHRGVGRKLPLRPGDALALFGGNSAEIGAGAREAGFTGEILSYETTDALRDRIASYPGAIMLKGSRGYALERALPAGLFGAAH